MSETGRYVRLPGIPTAAFRAWAGTATTAAGLASARTALAIASRATVLAKQFRKLVSFFLYSLRPTCSASFLFVQFTSYFKFTKNSRVIITNTGSTTLFM